MKLEMPLQENCTSLSKSIIAEQVRAHYRQIPAMAIAPTLGGLFTVWVLWGSVKNIYLVVGLSAVTILSGFRLGLYKIYFRNDASRADQGRWATMAVAAAFASGCLWGCVAPLLYPPQLPDYDVYLVVLLTLLPIVPVAALASYMPAFYAYFVPCMAPFVITLALRNSRAEKMTALLLIMMMGAMSTFARKFSKSLEEAIILRLRLGEKMDALEEAIKHKSQFIAAASHDLRQPVHAMGLFLESLRYLKTGSMSANQFIGYIDASLSSLRGMLNNMLDISKLEADVVTVRLEDISIRNLFEKLSSEFKPLFQQKALDFRCKYFDGMIRSDSALIERILRNLLSNALKYTSCGGAMLIGRHSDDRCGVLLQVVDTGVGIPVNQLESIFVEYTRVVDSRHAEASGLGLGLAIVQRQARLLGHSVSVRSREGRGSVFSIRLEAGQPSGHVSQLTRLSTPVREMPPGRVWIIDDDEAVGVGTAGLVALWGHRTSAFPSAYHALANGSEAPDLLIVDFRLGGHRSGLDAVALIRQRFGHSLPVILVTGDTEPRRIREAFEAGHMLLHKPVDPQRLHTCMGEAWFSRISE